MLILKDLEKETNVFQVLFLSACCWLNELSCPSDRDSIHQPPTSATNVWYLGSTGSVGDISLDVPESQPHQDYLNVLIYASERDLWTTNTTVSGCQNHKV